MHIMVDIETLATTADAAVVSIGAVKFDLTSDQFDDKAFYSVISMESNMDWDRHIDADTMRWWMDQSPEARNIFAPSTPKTGLVEALEDFAAWYGDPNQCIWSNGANFDEPILAHAFYHCRVPLPWKFWNVRCMRTYKNLPGAKDIVLPREGTHHNAMDDALHQARLLQMIHKQLFSTGKRMGAAR